MNSTDFLPEENKIQSNRPKILLLTSIYPSEDIPKSFTPVVHYFAKEWVRLGYEVIVVHNIAFYPRPLYFFSRCFNRFLNSLIGFSIPVVRYCKDIQYNIDGVDVCRMPMFKRIPHARFSKSVYEKQEKKIIELITKLNFKPDVIIGHWANPQLKLLSELKEKIGCLTCLIMHDSGKDIPRLFPKNNQTLFRNIDVWGFRSESIKKDFCLNFGIKKSTFLCYSGVPFKYITNDFNEKEFLGNLKTFAFVGQLIKRKYPVSLIDSLVEVYPQKEFEIKYVGSGKELKKLQKRIDRYGLERNIHIYEKLEREEVQKILCDVDCFVMISKGEAYGLVYLEAMAAGCLTIASSKGGFDGIIKHGENGFLCEAGNEKELSLLIKYINSLSVEEKKKISKNAQLTARDMTDEKCAKRYIYNVFAAK